MSYVASSVGAGRWARRHGDGPAHRTARCGSGGQDERPINDSDHQSSLPQDLDAWLAVGEGAFPDLVPGTEKHICWHDPSARRPTDLSVVYLHGFSATWRETHPLTANVGKALGANVFQTRLRGHGRGGAAMATATREDWLDDAREALAIGRRLGERVVLIGCSTGAILAAWLAAGEQREALAALALVAPNFRPANPAAGLLVRPFGAALARRLIGPEFAFEPVNADHGRYWTARYPVEALVEMMDLVRLVGRLNLRTVRTPTLMLYSRQDLIVSARAIERAFARLGAARKRLIEVPDADDPNHHVLAGDILSPTTTPEAVRLIVDFVRGEEASLQWRGPRP